MQPGTSPSGFSALGIIPRLLSILDRLRFTVPTPIQRQAIPVATEGKDVIGIAQTGTGKTFAFGLPLLQRLALHRSPSTRLGVNAAPGAGIAHGGGRALVLVPTRELAYQVEEALSPFAEILGIRTAVFVGGASMHLQRQMLRGNPRLLVATPGRLNDHLEQRTVTLREVSILVLDEADRMLDMGFKPQIDRILRHVPRKRQTMLFSATMPPAIVKLATREMTLPLRIEVAPSGTAPVKVEQELFIVRREDKPRLLLKLLQEYQGTVLVFSRTKHGAKKIARAVGAAGHRAAEIHSNRSLPQRRAALEGFRTRKHRILVATDIASRGIDVEGIEVVINYDLPDDPGDYVHRIGRTARAGRAGRAISFATPDQAGSIRDIERLTRVSIRRSSLPSLPPPPVPRESSIVHAGAPRAGRGPGQARFARRAPRHHWRRGHSRRRRFHL